MTAPYYADEDVTLYLGDCLEVLRGLPADSVDAIVTDPPAGIAFMGREWDDFQRARCRFTDWLTARMSEALRVLKPGGHALVWSIPRTSHWTAWALEDAGFEVRDCVLHVFGSGFPKSLDVSKAIDRMARRDYVLAAIELGLKIPGNNLHDWTKAEHSPGDEWWERFKAHLSPEQWGEVERAVVARNTSGKWHTIGAVGIRGGAYDITVPATEDAARWDGWGTALKPGQEMWWLARKPLAAGTVAANVLQYGTGGLNVGGCKVGTTRDVPASLSKDKTPNGVFGEYGGGDPKELDPNTGRWPTNLVFTHSAACDGGCAPDCRVAELDRQSGVRTSGSRKAGTYGLMGYMGADTAPMPEVNGDTGGASRFYPVFRYQAKAPTSERPRLEDGTAHETVKPLGFVRWAVRLITPPGGTVLDMFAGSGPVAEACIIEGFRCVIIEKERKSADLIRKRLSKPIQPVMFGLEA